MLMIQHIRTAAVALAFVIASPLCFAADGDAAPEATPAVSPATHGLFASWFGGVNSAADAAIADSEQTVATTRSMLSMGIPPTGSLVVGALGLLGISYRLGGNTPDSGFDCSGMVRYVFQNALGLDLPRRAEEISRVGLHVDRSALKPGDLVFYKTLRKAFSHVGIYLGNNRFIHAPSAGGAVRVDDMSQSYWATRFNGARRVATE